MMNKCAKFHKDSLSGKKVKFNLPGVIELSEMANFVYNFESMFSWYGKGDCSGGMPSVIKIRRKPKGIGCKAKTVADIASGIMLGLELNEGKEAMAAKQASEQGATTSTNTQADKSLAWKWPDCHMVFVVCLSQDCGPASQAWPLLYWSSEACPPEVSLPY